MASVKVAVRVRPFNQRELDHDCQCIIEMHKKKTIIFNPKLVTSLQRDVSKENKKEFSFDFSYLSINSSDQNFVSQTQVFEDLGKEVVDNIFDGYNACVFAYGQTGSGKTYTMMGTSESTGLIPRICQEMFNKMSANKHKGTTFRTEVSYMEIYNERVKDLLKKQKSHSLKIREHPKMGPYVQDLSKYLVMDYQDIQELMTKGNANRTTASTNMNDVSSRSHAIFTICFTQAKFSHEMPSETISKVNLVDLAGSERADASGATGQRLKEGAHINKSLVTLGSVISALADLSGQKKNVFIPYRDSALTWLLKDSLGGNSKTIMVATISPADINYGETLSTLRYANRAKNIINKPTINEDPNVMLIRELRAEISELKDLLNASSPSSDMMEKLQKNEAKVKLLTDQWEERWRETHKILKDTKLDLRKSMSAVGVVLDSEHPHLVGLEDDLLSTGITLYHLNNGETLIGTENASVQQDIVLCGDGIEQEHCVIELKDGAATLIPFDQSQCKVNFNVIDKPTRLNQGCVILLGRTHMFRYNDPAQVAELKKEKERGSHLNLSRLSLLDISRSTNDLIISKSLESLSPPSSLRESPSELEETLRFSPNGLLGSTSVPDLQVNSQSTFSSDDHLKAENENIGDIDSGSIKDKDNGFDDKIIDLKCQEIEFLKVGRQMDRNLSNKEMDASFDSSLCNNDLIHERFNDLIEQEVQKRLLERELNLETRSFNNALDVSSITPDSLETEIRQEFSISVPSFFHRGGGRNFHYEFEIVINTVDSSWTIYRRYRRFKEVFCHARRKYGDKVKLPELPPRYFIFFNTEQNAERRRVKLEKYLQDLVEVCSSVDGSDLTTSNGITRESLCQFSKFFEKGMFETGKSGTG